MNEWMNVKFWSLLKYLLFTLELSIGVIIDIYFDTFKPKDGLKYEVYKG